MKPFAGTMPNLGAKEGLTADAAAVPAENIKNETINQPKAFPENNLKLNIFIYYRQQCLNFKLVIMKPKGNIYNFFVFHRIYNPVFAVNSS